jgi:hypothetical protein
MGERRGIRHIRDAELDIVICRKRCRRHFIYGDNPHIEVGQHGGDEAANTTETKYCWACDGHGNHSIHWGVMAPNDNSNRGGTHAATRLN